MATTVTAGGCEIAPQGDISRRGMFNLLTNYYIMKTIREKIEEMHEGVIKLPRGFHSPVRAYPFIEDEDDLMELYEELYS